MALKRQDLSGSCENQVILVRSLIAVVITLNGYVGDQIINLHNCAFSRPAGVTSLKTKGSFSGADRYCKCSVKNKDLGAYALVI